jgi:hypothetical protein
MLIMSPQRREREREREGSNYLSHDAESTVSHINVVEAEQPLTAAESAIVQIKFDNVGHAFALAVRLQAQGLNPAVIRPELRELIKKELDELL